MDYPEIDFEGRVIKLYPGAAIPVESVEMFDLLMYRVDIAIGSYLEGIFVDGGGI